MGSGDRAFRTDWTDCCELIGLAEAFFGGFVEEGVGFAEDGGDAGGEGGFLEDGEELGVFDVGGVGAGEPVVGLAEEVVAHFGPVGEVEGFGVGPEAEDFGDVDLAGDIHVVGNAVVPVVAPVLAEGLAHGVAEAGFDGGDGGGGVVVVVEGADVFVKVGGTGGAAGKGVDFGAVEAVEVVEDYR